MDWPSVIGLTIAGVVILGLAGAVVYFAWLADKRLSQTVSMCMTWSEGEHRRLANIAEIETARLRNEAKQDTAQTRAVIEKHVRDLLTKNDVDVTRNGTAAPNLM